MLKPQRKAPDKTMARIEEGWSLIGRNTAPLEFKPVAAEEMAFAMELFVGFARGRCAVESPAGFSGYSLSGSDGMETMDAELLDSICRTDGAPGRRCHGDERSLDVTFRAVCNAYRDSDEKHSICARVLGFHLMMQRTGGRAIERWVSQCDGQAELVRIDPAVVKALGAVTLSRHGTLPMKEFLALVEELAAEA